MAAQRGKDLLLKIDRGLAAGGPLTVAGLRARTLTFNAEPVDATNQDSAGLWRELLAGAGLRSARIAGSGLFKDAASDVLMRQAFFGGVILDWQVVIPGLGTLTGPFQITSLAFTGRHTGEVTFELTLDSAGELTFTEL